MQRTLNFIDMTHFCAAALAFVALTFSIEVNAVENGNTLPQSQVNTGDGQAAVPDKSDSAEVAFKKLDKAAKGYVTLDDVAVLPGFATMFTNADSTHLGRLNLIGFTRAWTAYIAGKS